MELSKRYQPSEVEAKIHRFWEEGNFFRAAVGVVDDATDLVVDLQMEERLFGD